MVIISSVKDLRNWLADVRGDVFDVQGNPQANPDAAVEALRASDHPPYGEDWSEWLRSEKTREVIDASQDDNTYGFDDGDPNRDRYQ